MTLEPIQIHDTRTLPAAVVHLQIPRSAMSKAFPEAIHEILEALASQGQAPTGPPYARHFRLDPDAFDFEVGFPVELPPGTRLEAKGRVVLSSLPEAQVVRTVYHGPYEGLPAAWEAFSERIREAGLAVGDEFRERYVAGPEAGPDPAAWRTELSWVLRDPPEPGSG